MTGHFKGIKLFEISTFTAFNNYTKKNMPKSEEKFIVDESVKKTDVVLPLEVYEELLEDIHDLAIIAERKEESAISFDEIKKRLKADGLL